MGVCLLIPDWISPRVEKWFEGGEDKFIKTVKYVCQKIAKIPQTHIVHEDVNKQKTLLSEASKELGRFEKRPANGYSQVEVVEQVIATNLQEVKQVLTTAQEGLITVQEDISKHKSIPPTFIFRYQYLLIDVGTKLLRRVFDVMVSPHFAIYLAANTAEAQTLQNLIRSKKISPGQAQLLPPVEMNPDSSNFDLALLTCLLRNVCGLKPPQDLVWKNPSPSDISVEADITRLRMCRNQLIHSGTVFQSEADFTAKWNELRQILLRLSTVDGISNMSALINEAEKMDINEELTNQYDQIIKTWCMMEDLVHRGIENLQLYMKGDMYAIEEGQSAIEEGMSAIKEGMSAIKEGQKKLMENMKEVSEMLNLSKRTIENIEKNLHKYRPKQLDIDESDRKIYQMRSQLIELGTVVLQKHFHNRVGNDFAKYLASNEAEMTKLHWLIDTNRITELQVALLPQLCQTTPSSNDNKSEKTFLTSSNETSSSYMYEDDSDEAFSSLNSANFDIPLLTVLLKNVCGLRAPNDLVWREPSPMDMSIEADISRLGQCRNSVMKLKRLDEENVDELWKKLREILTRLGRCFGIIDDLFSSTGDAEFDDYLDKLNLKMLDEWYAHDQKDIKFEQEYPQADFFKDTDDDAWTKDEEKVSFLLREGILPNAKQLKQMCKRFGSSSPTVRKVCAYICNTLQMTSHHIKRCWPAYNENDVNLVTFVVVKDIKDTKIINDAIFGYSICELVYGCNSAETSEMLKYDIKNANKFNDEMDKIDECVRTRSLSLMHSHSNITLIAGSTVKSIGYLFKKEIIEMPCVVIYVHKKGYIPLGEKPFPAKLDRFDTDVRECVVSLFRNERAYEHNDNLLMGTSISNRRSIGTLGGFVEHSRYGLCGLTCAHVLFDGHLNGSASVKHWTASDPIIDVIQPASLEGASIGKVVCALLKQDQTFNLDIALVSIERRPPISGQFAIETTEDLNANEYNSGSVWHRNDIPRGAVIIKFGAETGRTEAQVVSRSSCFRYLSSIHYNQLQVIHDPESDHFAAEGDSGSLSFVENSNGLHAIGVVVAGEPGSGLCFITPLTDILEAFNKDSVQVKMKEFCEPMQE